MLARVRIRPKLLRFPVPRDNKASREMIMLLADKQSPGYDTPNMWGAGHAVQTVIPGVTARLVDDKQV
jgi:hypothetical protein